LRRIASGWYELGATRAVLLVQLEPGHVRDDARLDYFSTLDPTARVILEGLLSARSRPR
jgi:hypothetical protein